MNGEVLKSIGSAWKHPKTGEVRYYIDNDKAAEYGGLEIGRYKTGNIGYSYYKGEKISHSEAGRMMNYIYKVYVTENGEVIVQTDKYARDEYPGFVQAVIEGIKAEIEKAEVA